MAEARGMGRGLAAILSVSEAAEAGDAPELRDVAVELIAPNPSQPRKRFDDDTLAALARSLAERGVLQPVLVRPRRGGTYELVAGERRWRAARLAGLETVPALVQPRDDAESLEAALVENMAREDLNPVEAEVRRHFPSLVFDTVIPRNVRVSEAPSFGRPVIHHDPHCAGSDAYFELAKEVAARG